MFVFVVFFPQAYANGNRFTPETPLPGGGWVDEPMPKAWGGV